MLLVIAIFLIIMGIYYLKIDHNTSRIKIVLTVVLITFLYFSVVYVFSSNDVNLNSPSGIADGVYVYFGWVGQSAGNLWDVGVDTTRLVGNAIKNVDKEDKDKK